MKINPPMALRKYLVPLFALVVLLGILGLLLYAFRSEHEYSVLGAQTIHYRFNQRVGFDLDTDLDGDAETRVREHTDSTVEIWEDWDNDGTFEIYMKGYPNLISLFTFDLDGDGRPDLSVEGDEIEKLWKELAQEEVSTDKLEILRRRINSQPLSSEG